jgi:branched-chain amino acid transport system substrate-binding protein
MLHTLGQVLNNRYRIINLLGQGGFGAVYRAWDTHLNVLCAVKQSFESSPQAASQFNRAATILTGLRHPNLPNVTDSFSLPGQGQYLVMEYIEGEDLQVKLEKVDGPLPEARALAWADQILDALEYIHHQEPPIIHRDIKPANIRITPKGQAVLVDFGIAEFRDPAQNNFAEAQAVTPGYSPYEQYSLGVTDARTDIYALGATLYTLVTGLELQESVLRLVDDLVKPASEINPALSDNTSRAIQRAIQVDPRQRWQTAAEFRAALQGQPIPETTSGELSGLDAVGTPAMTRLARSGASEPIVLPVSIADTTRAEDNRLDHLVGISILVILVVAVIFAGLYLTDPFRWLGNDAPTRGTLSWTLYATRTAVAATPVMGASNEAATDTHSAARPQADETLRIGLMAPLTGSVPTFGISTKEGADLAVKEWNARGGVLGKKIELVIHDSRCEAEAAVGAANRLIFEEGIHYIVGEVCSRASIPVSEVANQNHVLMVSPVSTNPAVTVDEAGQTKPYVFRACFIDPFQGQVMAKFAKSQGYQTAFILYEQDDEYSVSLGDAFEEVFTAQGGRIVGKESHLASTSDFSAILRQVIDSQAEVLFVPNYYPVINQVGRQAKAMGATAVLMGGDGWDSPGLDLAAVEGGFFTNHFDMLSTRPILVKWLRRYGSAYNIKNPDEVAALTYDAVNLLLATIEKVGVDDPAKAAEMMAQMNWAGVTGDISFDAQHNPIKSATVLAIQQGKKVYVTTVEP